MNANMTMRYGLRDVRGYESIIPKHYVDTCSQLAPQVQLAYNRIAPIYTSYDGFDPHAALEFADPRPAQRALRRSAARRPPSATPGYTLAYEDEAVRIWQRDSRAAAARLRRRSA